MVTVNLSALPARPQLPKLAPADDAAIDQAANMIAKTTKVAIKAGGGTRGHDAAMRRLAETAGAAVILSPGSTGVLPDAHAQNMHVGGSKGSISGNLCNGRSRLAGRHRLTCRLSGGLLRDRIQARAGRDQHQRRSGGCASLQ
jgi:3D-(3,5/4)-trihydroxycyclohexane-1,2-dione acylhydrolase (decyclizing)